MTIRSHQRNDSQQIQEILGQRGTCNGEGIRVAIEVIDEARCYPERGAKANLPGHLLHPKYEGARPCYQKHGYREIGRLPDFCRQGDHKIIFV